MFGVYCDSFTTFALKLKVTHKNGDKKGAKNNNNINLCKLLLLHTERMWRRNKIFSVTQFSCLGGPLEF